MPRDMESAARGQKITTDTMPDRGTDKADGEAKMGRKFAGGPTDLSHSMNPNKYGEMAPKSRK